MFAVVYVTVFQLLTRWQTKKSEEPEAEAKARTQSVHEAATSKTYNAQVNIAQAEDSQLLSMRRCSPVS